MVKRKIPYKTLLTLIWLLCIVLVNPIGEFPLNDDWSYTFNVKALVLENRIFFDDWGAMTLFAHTLWGALFCKIFGFSFTVLRASTLVLGWVASIVSFQSFKEGGISEKPAFGLTLLLMFNPWFFSLSFTYMTDVPFLTFSLLSFYFFLKALHFKGNLNILYGTIFSVIAVLLRQPGVIIPIAFFCVFFLKNKKSLLNFFYGVTPFLVTYNSLSLFLKWRETNYGLSYHFGKTEDFYQSFVEGKFFYFLTERASEIFVHWGISLFPLLLILIRFLFSKTWKLKLVALFPTSLMVSFYWGKWSNSLVGNIFYNLGLGPKTTGEFVYGYVPPSQGTLYLGDWENLEFIGFLAGAFILYWIWVKALEIFKLLFQKKSKQIRGIDLFAFSIALGYFIFLINGSYFFDRYYFTLLPFIIFIIFPKENLIISKWWKIAASLFLGVLVFFSIGATKDYLEWNRSRWEAIDYVVKDLKVPLRDFNGGFEYNGWYEQDIFDYPAWESQDWWLAKVEKYNLSFSPRCGYEIVKSFPHQQFIPYETDSLFLLKKIEMSIVDSIFCNVEELTDDNKNILSNKKNVFLGNADTRVSNKSLSGNYSLMIHGDKEYAFTIELQNISPCEKIWISVQRSPEHHSSKGVISIDGQYLKSAQGFSDYRTGGWAKLSQAFIVPENIKNGTATFYFYNPSEEKVWLDDLTILRAK